MTPITRTLVLGLVGGAVLSVSPAIAASLWQPVPLPGARDASSQVHSVQYRGEWGWGGPSGYYQEPAPRYRHRRPAEREWGYRSSNGQVYPYCVIDLGYGRVEPCSGATPSR